MIKTTRLSTETNLRRGIDFSDALLSNLQTRQVKMPVNLLLVGIGSDDYFHCGYESYNIFARLEDAGIDYCGTVVDLLPELVDDFQKRREIFFSGERYGPAQNDQEYFWRRYLDLTNQREKIVNDTGALALQKKAFLTDFPTALIRSARIPSALEKRLEERTVLAVQGDIKTIDLQERGPFDAVSCTNVLYHFGYKIKDVFAALCNLTSSVCRDGLVYVDLPWVPVYDFESTISVIEAEKAIRLAGINSDAGPFSHSFRKTLPYGRPRRRRW